MKRIQSFIVCFLLIWFCFSTQAQNNISAWEFWFNNSYDDRQTYSINSAEEHYLLEDIDVSALPDGVNVLNIRSKNENNLYSSTFSKVFYKTSEIQEFSKNLAGYEMWFNNDYENRQVNSISTVTTHHLISEVDVSALPDGVNVVNIRYKNENNLSSSTFSKVFYKESVTVESNKFLAGYELWFNNDYENRQVNSVSANSEHHLLAEIDVSDLPDGVNTLNIRYKNENNLYSSSFSKVFYKTEQKFQGEIAVSAYKYWFDDGYENAEFIPLQTPAKQISILEILDVTHLAMGEHVVHFQFLDLSGKWSLIKSDYFTKTAIPEALFSVNNEIACANSPVLFINESIEADSFFWNFGDGNTSDEVEPEYIYAEAGEYQVILTAIDLASGRENESSQLITVEDCSEVCTNLQFTAGWNLFSVPAEPENTDLENLFQPLIDNGSLLKIQDEQGNALEDWGMIGGWRNFIGNITLTEGYKIRLAFEDELELCGLPVSYPFSIPLSGGWNIIGFPQTGATDAMKIIQPLIDNGSLQKVQDETGNAVEDWGMLGGWINFIGEFSPGKGYKIKLAFDDILWIQEAYPKSTTILPENVPASYFIPGFIGNGVDHMNINVTGLPENMLHPGDELAVFDGEICVGAKKLLPHHFASQVVSMPVSAKDQYGMPGFSEGNTIILKLWSSLNNREYQLEPEVLRGTSTFLKHESTLMSLEKLAITGLVDEQTKAKTEINCYPNPFSNEITIELSLNEELEVQVDVFNQLGQLVNVLAGKKSLSAGRHNIVWDGKNTANQQVSPGIYHVRLLTDEIQMIQKIIFSGK